MRKMGIGRKLSGRIGLIVGCEVELRSDVETELRSAPKILSLKGEAGRVPIGGIFDYVMF